MFKIARRTEERPTCPFCKERIAARDEVSACPLCDTEHHLACAKECPRCTVMGCGGTLRTERLTAPSAPVVAPAVSSTSVCDFVGGTIDTLWVVCQLIEFLAAILSIFV